MYAASVGDSKCIISCQGIAQELSIDHLPTNPDEFLRIKRAGGFVNHDRVNGSLAMSRAFGDFIFKQNEDLSAEDQAVTCKYFIKEKGKPTVGPKLVNNLLKKMQSAKHVSYMDSG